MAQPDGFPNPPRGWVRSLKRYGRCVPSTDTLQATIALLLLEEEEATKQAGRMKEAYAALPDDTPVHTLAYARQQYMVWQYRATALRDIYKSIGLKTYDRLDVDAASRLASQTLAAISLKRGTDHGDEGAK